MLVCTLAVSSACSSGSPAETVACPTGDMVLQSDLPSGKPCSGGSCTFGRRRHVGDAANGSVVDGWTCDCNGGHWGCAIASPGGGICGPTFGPYCSSEPRYGVSLACYQCCRFSPGDFGACGSYTDCYCNCEPTDSVCISACGNPFDLEACSYPFMLFSQCMGAKCSSECKGQRLPGMTVVDASVDGSLDADGE